MPHSLAPVAALLLGTLAASTFAQQGGAQGKPPARTPPQAASPETARSAADEPASETFAFDGQQPLLGQWIGEVPLASDHPMLCALRVTAGADGQLAGSAVHAYGASPCTTFTAEQRQLTLKMTIGPREMALTAEVAADGQTLTGKATLTTKGKPGEPFAVSFRREPRAAALPGARAWSGTLSIAGKGDYPFSIVLGSTPGGRLVAEVDSPALKLLEGPLTDVARKENQLSATWPSKPPVLLALTFSDDESALEGEARPPGSANAVKLALDEALLAQRVAALAAPPPAGDPK